MVRRETRRSLAGTSFPMSWGSIQGVSPGRLRLRSSLEPAFRRPATTSPAALTYACLWFCTVRSRFTSKHMRKDAGDSFTFGDLFAQRSGLQRGEAEQEQARTH
ncbi:hypothetical protein CLCR_07793 [Cladophialophora carrionii]|uniref:Uncharacterized protein n=1 Tax=Cladophialophora carrionii TaxID=86049 RepID=A0A1C1CQL7_9EURO|nr:hypothetical protein CLCR_07793 [Cladophialophora carrionii]